MPILNDVVRFDIARLFNGAIDVDWIVSDPEKAKMVSKSFVFHGPTYHGVSQKDISGTGHRLIDSASFFKNVLNNLLSDSDQPFTLAIAGFGSGKSHIALTLSQLLESRDEPLKQEIIDNIALADSHIASDIRKLVSKLDEKTLVITLNGMNNFDLSAEILSQAKAKLQACNISTEPLNELRQRFTHAASILKNFDASLLKTLLDDLGVTDKNVVFERLASFDEATYAQVHNFLQSFGIPLKAIGDETAKDVLKQLVSQYVGEDKPFAKILILFDEFGRYLEFATTRSQIAGNGALQQLYEGVQENAGNLSFIGFIQYELKAYEQRLPAEFKNDIRRFITRFQSSEKLYLSINLETLIASLLLKNNETLKIDDVAIRHSFNQLQNWYEDTHHHSLWNSEEMFARVIGKGCWPLSPFAVWVLFHLSAGGQYLQQRSALSLLKTALEENAEFELTDNCSNLPPVRLWSSELQSEFMDVEEQAGHNAIVQSYQSVYEKHRQHLSSDDILTLRSIVLISITRLRATSRDDAITALSVFSGITKKTLDTVLTNLEEELNIVSWDESFHQFDIIGDSVSKAQFLKFLRRKIDMEYDREQQEKLFINKSDLAKQYIKKLECNFKGEEITSSEWFYESRSTCWSLLPKLAETVIAQHIENTKYCQVDTPRGLVFYCYVSSNESIDDVKLSAKVLLRSITKAQGLTHAPVIFVLLHDPGEMGKIMAELDIIEKLSPQDRELYGKMASIHAERRIEALQEEIKKAIMQRHYITTFSSESLPMRLSNIGDFIFEQIYTQILLFPFDNYRSTRTNAASDCAEFTRALLLDEFSYAKLQNMPMRQQNRANRVLKDTWKIFNQDGSIKSIPGSLSAKAIVSEWEKDLKDSPQGLNCGAAIEMACAAPYGANIASAGLLLAVFIQARRKIIYVEEQGKHIELQTLSNRLFEGHVVSVKTLQNIHLFKNEDCPSEWEQLLNDWGNASSYAAYIEFADKAEELESRIPIPHVYAWKMQELKKRSDDARQKIDEADEKEEKAIGIIERALPHNDLYNISYGASLLHSYGRKKMSDSMWREEDYSYFADHIKNAQEVICQCITDWLPSQRPANRTQSGLTEFRSRLIEKMGKSLKELGLASQYSQVEQYYGKVSKSFELIAECQEALGSVGVWLANNKAFVANISLAQLKSRKEEMKAHFDLLKRPKAAMTKLKNTPLLSEIDEKINGLHEIASRIELQVRKIEDKAKAIWATKLTPSSAEKIGHDLADLIVLYAGYNSDVDDFRNMLSAVRYYIDCIQKLSDLNISIANFCTQFKLAQDTFNSRFSECELPWDLEKAFDLLQKHCQEIHQQATIVWLIDVRKQTSDLSSMTISQGNRLLAELDSPPPYVDIVANNKSITEAKQKIEHFLISKEVEWLLERFKNMSSAARAEFLKALKKEM